MKWAILLAIRSYWRLIPPSARRRCVFADSCSQHVYRHTAQRGALAGLAALRVRVRACRPGYSLLEATDEDGVRLFRLADGSVARAEVLAPTIVRVALEQKRSSAHLGLRLIGREPVPLVAKPTACGTDNEQKMLAM